MSIHPTGQMLKALLWCSMEWHVNTRFKRGQFANANHRSNTWKMARPSRHASRWRWPAMTVSTMLSVAMSYEIHPATLRYARLG